MGASIAVLLLVLLFFDLEVVDAAADEEETSESEQRGFHTGEPKTERENDFLSFSPHVGDVFMSANVVNVSVVSMQIDRNPPPASNIKTRILGQSCKRE